MWKLLQQCNDFADSEYANYIVLICPRAGSYEMLYKNFIGNRLMHKSDTMEPQLLLRWEQENLQVRDYIKRSHSWPAFLLPQYPLIKLILSRNRVECHGQNKRKKLQPINNKYRPFLNHVYLPRFFFTAITGTSMGSNGEGGDLRKIE